VIALFQVVLVLVLRAHYTMDVFTGAVVAVLAAIAAARLAGPLDRWVASVVSVPVDSGR
jgi:membrane-associated phospholipid phosphatase